MLRFTPNKASDDVTYNNFVQGNYDQFIFNKTPQLTNELRIILSKYNRDFIQRLFTKCESRETLDFWVQEAGAKLPKDSIALAINLGNNIIVLNYLKEKGWLDNLSGDDKDKILSRAQRFPGEGLEYLKTEFSKKVLTCS